MGSAVSGGTYFRRRWLHPSQFARVTPRARGRRRRGGSTRAEGGQDADAQWRPAGTKSRARGGRKGFIPGKGPSVRPVPIGSSGNKRAAATQVSSCPKDAGWADALDKCFG